MFRAPTRDPSLVCGPLRGALLLLLLLDGLLLLLLPSSLPRARRDAAEVEVEELPHEGPGGSSIMIIKKNRIIYIHVMIMYLVEEEPNENGKT